MTIKIPLDDLMNVLPFKGRDDVRWALNGVLVEPHKDGGAMLIATNGHVCGFFYSATAVVTERQVLELDDKFVRGMRELTAANYDLVLEFDHLVVQSHAGAENLVKPGRPFIDSKYPNTLPIIPKEEDLEPGIDSVVSSVYLSELRRKRENGYDRGVMFWQRKDKTKESAILARFLDLPNLVVLIMPIRGDRFEKALPEWMPTSGS